jgi:poly(3-hydroxyalkanoate) synthetase
MTSSHLHCFDTHGKNHTGEDHYDDEKNLAANIQIYTEAKEIDSTYLARGFFWLQSGKLTKSAYIRRYIVQTRKNPATY